MRFRRYDEEHPAASGPVAQSEARAEPLLQLGEPVLHLAGVGSAPVQVVVDDETLAPVQVGGQLVEVSVLGAVHAVARQPRHGMVAIVQSEQSADPGSQRLELSHLGPD